MRFLLIFTVISLVSVQLISANDGDDEDNGNFIDGQSEVNVLEKIEEFEQKFGEVSRTIEDFWTTYENHVSDANGDITELKSDLEQLNQMVRELNNLLPDIDSNRNNNRMTSDRVNELEEKISATNDVINQLKDVDDENEQKFTEITQQIEQITQSLQQLKQPSAPLPQVHTFSGEIDVTQRLANNSLEIEQLRQDIMQLRNSTHQKMSLDGTLTQSMTSLQTSVTNLLFTVQMDQVSSKMQQQKLSENIIRVTELNDKINVTFNNLEQLSRQMAHKFENLNSTFEQNANSIDKAIDDITNLSRDVDQLRNEIMEAITQELNEIRQQLQYHVSRVEELSRNLQDIDANFKTNQIDVNDRISGNSQKVIDNQNLINQIHQQLREIDQLHDSNTAAQSQHLQEFQTANTKLQDNSLIIEQLLQKNTLQDDEILRNKEAIGELNQQFALFKDDYVKVEQERNRYKREAIDCATQLITTQSEFETSNLALKSELSIVQGKLRNCSQTNDEKQQFFIFLLAKAQAYDALVKEKQDLVVKMTQLEQKLQSRVSTNRDPQCDQDIATLTATIDQQTSMLHEYVAQLETCNRQRTRDMSEECKRVLGTCHIKCSPKKDPNGVTIPGVTYCRKYCDCEAP